MADSASAVKAAAAGPSQGRLAVKEVTAAPRSKVGRVEAGVAADAVAKTADLSRLAVVIPAVRVAMAGPDTPVPVAALAAPRTMVSTTV
jgi:hypothetical protein